MEPTELPFYFSEEGTVGKRKKAVKHLQEQNTCRHKQQGMKSEHFHGIMGLSL